MSKVRRSGYRKRREKRARAEFVLGSDYVPMVNCLAAGEWLPRATYALLVGDDLASPEVLSYLVLEGKAELSADHSMVRLIPEGLAACVAYNEDLAK